MNPNVSINDPLAAFNVRTAGGMAYIYIGSFFKTGWRFTNEKATDGTSLAVPTVTRGASKPLIRLRI